MKILSDYKRSTLVPFICLAFLCSLKSFAQDQEIQPKAENCRLKYGKLQTNNRYTLKNDAIKSNSFTVSRDLNQYGYAFSFDGEKDFAKSLNELPPGAFWIDMGAGDAVALNEGLDRFPQIKKGIAISYKKTDSAISNRPDDRFDYLHGDYVENMWSTGKLDHLKGKVDLITDVHGPLAYSSDLKNLFQIYADLLKPGGKLNFTMMSKRNFTPGVNSAGDARFVNSFRSSDREVELSEWLDKIPGLKIKAIKTQTSRTKDLYEEYISIQIEKTDSNVIVPDNLRSASYFPSTPPRRIFVIDENPNSVITTQLDLSKGAITKEQIETVVKSASAAEPVTIEITTATTSGQKLAAIKQELIDAGIYKNWTSTGNAVKWILSISDPKSAKKIQKIVEENENMVLEINWK